MLETLHKKKTPYIFSIYYSWLLPVIIFCRLHLLFNAAHFICHRAITPFNEALFTSTSAVCVTGLVYRTPARYWSFVGQLIILILIQTGGLGVVTVAAFVLCFPAENIPYAAQHHAKCHFSTDNRRHCPFDKIYFKRNFYHLNFLGALLMMPIFIHDFGINGLWMSVFHSISAFCNVGI